MGVKSGDIVVEVLLRARKGESVSVVKKVRQGGSVTNGSDGVVSQVCHDGMFKTILLTSVGTRITIAYCRPGPIDSSATT